MLYFLVGYAGAGKSSIGETCSKQTNIPFFDLDHVISQMNAMSIDDLFKNFGENHFRKLESQALCYLIANESSALIATGGGTPCFHNNMSLMKKSGVSFYLKNSTETLVRNLASSHSRPLLDSIPAPELHSHIESMLSLREAHYLQANHTITCDNKSISRIAKEIQGLLLS